MSSHQTAYQKNVSIFLSSSRNNSRKKMWQINHNAVNPSETERIRSQWCVWLGVNQSKCVGSQLEKSVKK